MDPAARDALRAAISAEHKTIVQAQTLRSDAERWSQRAQLAATRGDDELATQALERRGQLLARAERLELEAAKQGDFIRQLKGRQPAPAIAVAGTSAPSTDKRIEAMARAHRLDTDLEELKRQLRR